MNEVCPHCGQRMLRRLGVQLSPKLADIFDVVSRRSPAGVDIETLLYVLFPDKDKRKARAALKTHLWLLNERLVETDFRVKVTSHKSGIYKLARVTNE